MKVSDFITVSMILRDRGTIGGALKELRQVNGNSRHILVSAGYFPDSTKGAELGPLVSDDDISTRVARKIIAASVKAFQDELDGMNQRLHELNVEVDE